MCFFTPSQLLLIRKQRKLKLDADITGIIRYVAYRVSKFEIFNNSKKMILLIFFVRSLLLDYLQF